MVKLGPYSEINSSNLFDYLDFPMNVASYKVNDKLIWQTGPRAFTFKRSHLIHSLLQD